MNLFTGWKEFPAKLGPTIHNKKLMVGHGDVGWQAEFGREKPNGLGKFTAVVQGWQVYRGNPLYIVELFGARKIELELSADCDPLYEIEQWVIDRINNLNDPDNELVALFGGVSGQKWADYLKKLARQICEYRDPVLRLINQARRAQKARRKMTEKSIEEMSFSGALHQIVALQKVLRRALPKLSDVVTIEYGLHGKRPRAEFVYENTRWSFVPVGLLDPIDHDNNIGVTLAVYGNYIDRPVEFAECAYDMSTENPQRFEAKLLESMGDLLIRS